MIPVAGEAEKHRFPIELVDREHSPALAPY
jgi:hypothetical protein